MSENQGAPSRAIAIASVAGGAALLGFAPIGVRLSEIGPQATAFWRFAFALPLLFLLCAVQRSAPPRNRLAILIVAGICFGLDIAFWHWALGLTTVVNATLASNMTPIIAAAAGWLLFKERITGAYAIGAGVALAGAILLSYARAMGSGVASGQAGLTGDVLGLVSAVWYAAYLIIMRGVRAHVSAVAAMFATTAAAALFALALSLAVHEALLPHSLNGWLVLIGLGIVVHVGGQGLIAYGLGHLPIALSTILLWVQPIAAAAFSWMLFGEALTPLAFAGAALLLTGVWVVQRFARAAPSIVERP
ncbi:MAG: DMT family transporter [Hyphomonadaceae bacterium]